MPPLENPPPPLARRAKKFEAIVAAPQAKIYRVLFRAAGKKLNSCIDIGIHIY
jgi:hypothetical protein